MKIAFLVNPLNSLKSDDSSIQILSECINRKHDCIVIERDDLFFDEGKLKAKAYEGKKALNFFKKNTLCTKDNFVLSNLDALLMRQDPPFDEDYVYLTYLLETIQDRTFIFNDPCGVRNANEKLFPVQFSQFIPPLIITKSEDEIKKFLKKFPNGIVLKPLNNKGGSGILYINNKDVNKNELIKMATENGNKFIMAQKFLKEIRQGDKRITILDGECINSFIRIPHKEDFRGNICSGAKPKKSKITKTEQAMLDSISPILKQMGLYLVGIDLIGGYITEINSTSPVIANSLYPDTAAKIVDFIEKMAKTKVL